MHQRSRKRRAAGSPQSLSADPGLPAAAYGLAATLLALALLLIYGGCLATPTYFDDGYQLTPDNLARWRSAASLLEQRGIFHFSLGIVDRWWPGSILAQRAFSLALHWANALLLSLLVQRLLLAYEQRATRRGAALSGMFGGACLALHPTSVYAVHYLAQRSTLIATCFVLCASLLLLAYLSSGKRRWLAPAVLLAGLAIGAKEVAAPILLLLGGATLQHELAAKTTPEGRPSRSRLLGIAGLFAALAALGAFALWLLFGSDKVLLLYEPYAVDVMDFIARSNPAVRDHPWLYSAAGQSLLFYRYALIWLMPALPLHAIDAGMLPPAIALPWPAALALLLLAGLAPLALCIALYRTERKLTALAIAYAWIMFLTEYSTLRYQEPFVAYRSYLWAPGLIVALVVYAYRWFSSTGLRRRWGTVLGVVALIALTTLAGARAAVFTSPLLIWRDAIERFAQQPNPNMARAYNNLANQQVAARDLDGALQNFAQALQCNPRYTLAAINRSLLLNDMGRPGEALTMANEATRLAPDLPGASYAAGRALAALDRLEEADLAYSRALALAPGDAEALRARGIIKMRRRLVKEARQDFSALVEARPEDADARHLLGRVLADLGDYATAVSLFSEALRLAPDNAQYLFSRGLTHLVAGDRGVAGDDLLGAARQGQGEALRLLQAASPACVKETAGDQFAFLACVARQADSPAPAR